MRVDRISSAQEFHALQSEWNALLAASRSESVFLTWEWLSAWWESYGAGKQLLVLVAREDQGMLLGIAPLYVEMFRLMGRKRRRLRFLGDGSSDSDYLDFVILRGEEENVLPAFLQQLDRLKSDWDVAQWNEIPGTSPNLALLRGWLARQGWFFRQEEVPCGVVTLPESWEGYVGSLKPRFRTAVRASLRNLQQWPGRIERLGEEKQREAWLRRLFELHGGRWQLRGQHGVFADPRKREFYRQMSQAFLTLGWLHFTRCSVHDSVLACQFGFVYRNTYCQLQEGFDTASGHAGPGIALRAATIRQLIESGVRQYDFLGGMGRHKSDWGAVAAPSYRCAMAPPTAAGFGYVRLPSLVERAKNSMKRNLPHPAVEWLQSVRSGLRRTGQPVSTAANSDSGSPAFTWRNALTAAFYHGGAARLAERLSRSFEMRSACEQRLPRLRRAGHPKFVILSYHRVGRGGIPLYSALAPEQFEQQIVHLRKRHRIVSLDELYRGLQEPESGERGIAITFDDGYRDIYTHAFPTLRKYGVPATVFLTVGSTESGQAPWYDRVFLALQVAPGDRLDLVLDQPRRFSFSSPSTRFRAALELVGHLRKLPDERRKQCCRQMEKQVQLPPDELKDRMLDWDQVREMHRAGIAFGSHTVSHPVISRLAPTEMESELADSKRIIEQRLGASVRDFAFPFGRLEECGPAARSVLVRCGYRLAVTTEAGVNIPGRDLFALRRSSIGETSSMAQFATQLSLLFLREANRGDDAMKTPQGASAGQDRLQDAEVSMS